MDALIEKISYKDVPITICMKDFNNIEQYEIIRMVLGSGRIDISICTHESTTPYIDSVLKQLHFKFTQCYRELPTFQRFDLPDHQESH